MQLCRFHLPDHGPRLGCVQAAQVFDLTATGVPHFATLGALLQASLTSSISDLLHNTSVTGLPTYRLADLLRAPTVDALHLLPPVDQQEVWAAGVTYAWSREARVREAVSKDIYVRVYEAERPELFFKSTPEKVVGPQDWIGLRGDSRWNVPEPELVLVLNPRMEIVGYTIGNDVSSRDIEGENPLYLPQAKIYRRACALGPLISLAEQPQNNPNLAIRLTIRREHTVVFQAETNTAQLHRPLTELAAYLGRYNDFPAGALLFTGTGIVPGDDFTLHHGDEVAIEIETIGVLQNSVRQM